MVKFITSGTGGGGESNAGMLEMLRWLQICAAGDCLWTFKDFLLRSAPNLHNFDLRTPKKNIPLNKGFRGGVACGPGCRPERKADTSPPAARAPLERGGA